MRRLLTVIAAVQLCAVAALGQTQLPAPGPKPHQAQTDPDAIISSANGPLPQREIDFIRLIYKARKQYAASKSIDARKYARVDMQIAIHNFMGLSHSAENWVGIFKASTKTQDGAMSLEIEISPGVTVLTWENNERDRSYGTLIKSFSPLGKIVNTLAIGDTVVFSGNLLGSVVTTDDDMVLHPQVVVHFNSLTKPPPQ